MQTFKAMTRKFPQSAKVWLRQLAYLQLRDDAEGTRKLLDRATSSTPARKHIKVSRDCVLLCTARELTAGAPGETDCFKCRSCAALRCKSFVSARQREAAASLRASCATIPSGRTCGVCTSTRQASELCVLCLGATRMLRTSLVGHRVFCILAAGDQTGRNGSDQEPI